jgi:hypothetical protein
MGPPEEGDRMKYILILVFALVAVVVGLFVWDMVNVGIGERRVKEARFYLENADGTVLTQPNPDEASKLAARAIKKLTKYPTLQKARREAAVEGGNDVMLRGLTGMFAEQYERDLRFHPGPQWKICEARAKISDVGFCVEAAAVASRVVAHRQFNMGLADAGTEYIRQCVAYEDRPEVATVCKERAGEWLGDEAAELLEEGNAEAAADAMRACVKNEDLWAPSASCLADWHRTVRRARNALIPEFKSCEAILFYTDMPEGISDSDRQEAEAELAELRSTTALIWTEFHYDTLEFAPSNKYWGRGEESTKFHLSQVLTPAGYTIQWDEEEHPEGAWDACDPGYEGKIVLHEKRGKQIQAFHKEVLTVRPSVEFWLNVGETSRTWIKDDCEGREPKEWFADEEFFLDQAARAREAAWQNAHDQMREWELDGPATAE